MKIYVSHLRNFDFKTELYDVLKNSGLKHEFIFPHENSEGSFDSKSLFQNKECDLVLAEVSYPSTGQGIELGWADLSGLKIICIYNEGSRLSNSLKMISQDFIEYSDGRDLVNKLSSFFKENYA